MTEGGGSVSFTRLDEAMRTREGPIARDWPGSPDTETVDQLDRGAARTREASDQVEPMREPGVRNRGGSHNEIIARGETTE